MLLSHEMRLHFFSCAVDQEAFEAVVKTLEDGISLVRHGTTVWALFPAALIIYSI